MTNPFHSEFSLPCFPLSLNLNLNLLYYHAYANKWAKSAIICTEHQPFPCVSGDLFLWEIYAGKAAPCQRKQLVSQTTDYAYMIGKSPTSEYLSREKKTERERERHVAGSHIPLLLEKYKALWPHVRCQWKSVFILKQKQALTQQSTPKHIHPHS